jgi:pyruvate/2-oxoglutarate dehydrogenase complex dihydrolipoamide dehydrogenase (E3) component
VLVPSHAAGVKIGVSHRMKPCDYAVIPWCTFTDPEVARVGLNEVDAAHRGIAYEMTSFDISELDRAIADGVDYGFVRVLTAPGTDRILGASFVGEHAGDLLSEFVLAMKHGLGLNKILGTIHIYPTLAESSKAVAGQWRRTHAPQWLLKLARQYLGLAVRG